MDGPGWGGNGGGGYGGFQDGNVGPFKKMRMGPGGMGGGMPDLDVGRSGGPMGLGPSDLPFPNSGPPGMWEEEGGGSRRPDGAGMGMGLRGSPQMGFDGSMQGGLPPGARSLDDLEMRGPPNMDRGFSNGRDLMRLPSPAMNMRNSPQLDMQMGGPHMEGLMGGMAFGDSPERMRAFGRAGGMDGDRDEGGMGRRMGGMGDMGDMPGGHMGMLSDGPGGHMGSMGDGPGGQMGPMRGGPGGLMGPMRDGPGGRMGPMRDGPGEHMGDGPGGMMGGMGDGPGGHMGPMRDGPGVHMGGMGDGPGGHMGGRRDGRGGHMGDGPMGGMHDGPLGSMGDGPGGPMGGMGEGPGGHLGPLRDGPSGHMSGQMTGMGDGPGGHMGLMDLHGGFSHEGGFSGPPMGGEGRLGSMGGGFPGLGGSDSPGSMGLSPLMPPPPPRRISGPSALPAFPGMGGDMDFQMGPPGGPKGGGRGGMMRESSRSRGGGRRQARGGGRGGGGGGSRNNMIVPQITNTRKPADDFCQHFVDTGERPQNFLRDAVLTDLYEEHPFVKELFMRKEEIVTATATPPFFLKADLKEFKLSMENLGTKFDVALIDPPWEEYKRRAPGVDSGPSWTWEEIRDLELQNIMDTPSFVFLWCGTAEGLDAGRHILKKWGFRRCEDICWIKTNLHSANKRLPVRPDGNSILQHTKEHCLMGIKGMVRRATDGHIIHANCDTDIIVDEEAEFGSTRKPAEMYNIIERFCQGRRRIELFGTDHNIRRGWVTIGIDLSTSNFNPKVYANHFVGMDGMPFITMQPRVQPGMPNMVGTTDRIEELRPKSPVRHDGDRRGRH
eukprot:jgi/Botrbrau1/6013/Bobra.104_1s0040.1